MTTASIVVSKVRETRPVRAARPSSAGRTSEVALVGRRNRSRVLALSAVVTGVGFGLTAVADHALLYGLTVLVWTVGEMLNSPSNSTLIAELSPADLRGRYQGVFSLAWSVASFGAPILGGLLQEHAGNTALWLSCAGIGMVVAVGHLLSGPARERRAAQLRAAPDESRVSTFSSTS